MSKQISFVQKIIIITMKTLIRKIFRPTLKDKIVDSTTYRLLRMNRKLTIRQGK